MSTGMPPTLHVHDSVALWSGVLVGHSVSGIIATRTALMPECSPSLVISVEGNLTPADA